MGTITVTALWSYGICYYEDYEDIMSYYADLIC